MPHSSHLQQLCSLTTPGIVPEPQEDVGVEEGHHHKRNHKYYQENYSKISFLQTVGPSAEIADALVTNDSFNTLRCDLKNE